MQASSDGASQYDACSGNPTIENVPVSAADSTAPCAWLSAANPQNHRVARGLTHSAVGTTTRGSHTPLRLYVPSVQSFSSQRREWYAPRRLTGMVAQVCSSFSLQVFPLLKCQDSPDSAFPPSRILSSQTQTPCTGGNHEVRINPDHLTHRMVPAPPQLYSVTREERVGWGTEVIKRVTNMDVVFFTL